MFLSDIHCYSFISQTHVKERCCEESNGSFLRQPIPERSIPAPGAEDSPESTYVLAHIATTRWPVSRARGKFYEQELQMILPAHLLFKPPDVQAGISFPMSTTAMYTSVLIAQVLHLLHPTRGGCHTHSPSSCRGPVISGAEIHVTVQI